MRLFFALLFFVQLSQANTLVGKFTSCFDGRIYAMGRELKITQDGNLVADQRKGDYLGDFKVSNLKLGVCVVSYRNIFGQIVKKQVAITKEMNTAEFCSDEWISVNESTLINSLKSGETLTVKFISVGCFHSKEEEFKIKRIGAEYSATFIPAKGKIKKIVLSIKQLNDLIEFEKKLKLMNKLENLCTTTNSYDFMVNDVMQMRLMDGTCN